MLRSLVGSERGVRDRGRSSGAEEGRGRSSGAEEGRGRSSGAEEGRGRSCLLSSSYAADYQ